MKLKEFSLWAYDLELNESRAFTLENRCVCAHFERHFIGVDTKGIYRVVIKLCEENSRDGTTEISSSVLKYSKGFDFSSFYKLDFFERKNCLLSTLYDSLLKICQENGWPIEPFVDAKEKVIEDRFNNSYEVSKKNNRSRSMIASLNAEHTSDSFTLYIVVNDKCGNELYRDIVFSEEPDDFLFGCQIGRIKWESNDVLSYLSKDKSATKIIRISS